MGALGNHHPPAAPDRVGTTPRSAIFPIAPRPGRTLAVSNPLAYVGATVTAPTTIERVELRLDGQRVTPAVGGRDATHQSVFYRPRRWVCGRHRARFDVWDAAGAHAWRTWSFRLTAAS